MRYFAGIDLAHKSVPDATTLQRATYENHIIQYRFTFSVSFSYPPYKNELLQQSKTKHGMKKWQRLDQGVVVVYRYVA